MKELLLTIDVLLDEVYEVNGKHGEVIMILFHGSCTGDYFEGTILSGGVDTQIQKQGKDKCLSARYMLEGKDYTGHPCRIYIENNGTVKGQEDITAYPVIYTDSESLQWIEGIPLVSTVEGKGDSRVEIRIYGER